MELSLLYYAAVYLGPLLLLIGGFFMLRFTELENNENFLTARAPRLKSNELHDWDDAWIEGQLICKATMRAPKFGIECVHYFFETELDLRSMIFELTNKAFSSLS